MAIQRPWGECSICGVHCQLTWEHVPPEAAFNKARIRMGDPNRILGARTRDVMTTPHGRYIQRGSGRFSLCEKCNNITGHWYGTGYVNWAIQGMRHLRAAPNGSSMRLPFHILPGRVFKQIITMFASVCGPKFFANKPELRRLVLNRDIRGCPPYLRLYCYYQASGSTFARQAGITGLVNLDGPTSIFAEMAFPPFGYLVAMDSPVMDQRLVDITFFSESAYTDYRDLYISFPVLPTDSPFPGDFRTTDQLHAAWDASMAAEGGQNG